MGSCVASMTNVRLFAERAWPIIFWGPMGGPFGCGRSQVAWNQSSMMPSVALEKKTLIGNNNNGNKHYDNLKKSLR
jgi:hypothetical protein